ncbi:tetratricopeptide repeat protein, partial [Microcoleus sp. CZ3-B2]
MTQESEKRQPASEKWNQEDYLALTEARKRELVRIQGLIDEDWQTPEQKAELFLEQSYLYIYAEEYAKALASYDKALEIKPENHEVWYNRGYA